MSRPFMAGCNREEIREGVRITYTQTKLVRQSPETGKGRLASDGRPLVDLTALTSLCLVLLFLAMERDLAFALTGIPGEGQDGFLYALAHLHPAAYAVLFLIFVLSVANLVFHHGFSALFRPVSFLSSFLKGHLGEGEPRPLLRRLSRSELHNTLQDKPYQAGSSVRKYEPRADWLLSVRRVSKISYRASATPTPLDGVDHPLPAFSSRPSVQSGAPRLVTPSAEKKPSTEFKFSSTVDLPSREEIERREKSQLVVSGSVVGLDDKGMSSVIVCLTDSEGNRVGQSCRSAAETGEFKVLINEPGQYVLKGYKRGFVMESTEPLIIPIESGKIEGYNFRMIPEGCTIVGRVLLEQSGEGMPDYEVRCSCRTWEAFRSARTGASGQFRIQGVPMNSECFLEVFGKDGNLVTRSARFQTVQKKECYVEIKLPSRDQATADSDPESVQPAPDSDQPAQAPNSSSEDQNHATQGSLNA